jgi:ABC-type lipoprotein release transport system permease subunit
MKFSDVIQTALANLGRRKVRSFLTVFGIFVGIVTVVAMTSLGVGVQKELERNIRAVGLETIIVFPQVAEGAESIDPFAPVEVAQPITPEVVAEIEALPGVASVAPSIMLPAFMDTRVRVGEEEAAIRLITEGGEDAFEPDPNPDPVAGRNPEPGEQRGIVLSRATVEQLGIEPEAAIEQAATLIVTTPRGESTEVATTIIGVYASDGNSASVGLEESAAIKGWWYNRPNFLAEDGYDTLVVRARSIEAVPGVTDALDALDLQTQSLQQVLDLAARIFAVLQSLLASVGILALFVASLGVVNTMIMAIYERTREIGVLKATGAAPGDIRLLFMVEAAMMGFIGGVTGVIFGGLLGRFVDWVAHRYLESEQITGVGALSVVPPWLALGALLFGTMVGLLAGLYPAARAARLDPVQALRYD